MICTLIFTGGTTFGETINGQTSVKKKSPRAEEIAFRLLAHRDHSLKELRQKLLIRKVSSAEADALLQRLYAKGLLDDGRYARKLAFHLTAEKLLGPRRVREKLARKGIAPELLAEAAKDAEREFPPDERLKRLAQTKLKQRTLRELSLPEQKKLARFLYQRGFSWGDIQEFFHKAGGWFEE
jgi:SOS response regulatory protein OraA/RecX